MTNQERLEMIEHVIERHRYNLATSTCQIAKEVIEVDEKYLAGEEVRTDHFHSGSSI